MDAVKFIKEYERMCSSIHECNKCPLNFLYRNGICSSVPVKYPEQAVSAVEKWSAEHPVKTLQSKLLEVFPNAEIEDGVALICPNAIDKNFPCKEGCCEKCLESFWLSELKEE